MAETLDLEGRSQRVECLTNSAKMFILFADIQEGISKISETTVEFLSDKTELDGKDFLGKEFKIEMDIPDEDPRCWIGTCVEFLYVGESTGMGHGTYGHYRVELRSKVWLLTRTSDCRIYQEKTTQQIIQEVFSDNGISDSKFSLSKTHNPRPYCVQYNETDFDFIVRLMEEEGMFYYFDHADKKDKIVICDDSATLGNISGEAKIKHHDLESGQRETDDFIHKWETTKRFNTGSVTMMDYDFTKSRTEVKGTRQAIKALTDEKKWEKFDYPGKFKESSVGVNISKLRVGAIKARGHRIQAEGLVKLMEVAHKFELKEHPIKKENDEYLVLDIHHKLRIEKTDEVGDRSKTIKHPNEVWNQDDIIEAHSVSFECQPATVDFTPPITVDWPCIGGLQTALVVGPKGEEIFTDEFGRVKVQFHWDRYGKKDDKSSCFIRVVTPMSGKGWGAFHIPRIGQEVVVQFEEGDPDRPIITGMLYNDFNTTPESFPGKKTQLGFRTDVHKNEDKKAFSELVIEDEKDKEFINMISEKDYTVKIKNNSTIDYGTGDKDEGTLTTNVWKQTTQTFGTGSGEGGLKQTIQDDFVKDVEVGKYELTVKANERITTINKDETLTVETGNMKTTVDSGDQTTTVTSGNITHKASAGEMTLDAATKITLKCGGSTITMTPGSIEMKSPQITVQGNGTVDVTSPATTVEGSGMLTLKGGMVKIN